MPDKKKKRTKPKTGINTLRLQAVLNRNYFREHPAIEVYESLVKNPDWNDRKIIAEGLIALGEKLDTNWQVPNVPTEVTIRTDILAMMGQLQGVITMLANMDITQLRQVKGFDETVYNGMTAEGLKKGAARLLSEETDFEGEDW